ncbi:MAG: hypothetical protein KAS66_07635 [Candidatus Omnitrophica bacterium]|nr:hypothetical protein [Candidatus Omnitrophota bacterium]
MPKSNNWINYGDVNPREHGGLFVRYDPKHKEYEIVQTTSSEDFDGFDFSYFFEHNIVKMSALLEDKGLHSFAGIEKASTGYLTESEVIYALTSYIPYYGSDNGGYQVNNYWGELKSYGIYTSILNKK